jgi:hypothetical protein
MPSPANPFENIESAHLYIRLLRQQVEEVEASVAEDIALLSADGSRRLDALRLVKFKLGALTAQLGASSRTLNDLRALRRLLLGTREDPASDAAASTESELHA